MEHEKDTILAIVRYIRAKYGIESVSKLAPIELQSWGCPLIIIYLFFFEKYSNILRK